MLPFVLAGAFLLNHQPGTRNVNQSIICEVANCSLFTRASKTLDLKHQGASEFAGGFVKPRLLASPLAVLTLQMWGRTWGFVFLIYFQLEVTLLVQGPHFEKCWSRVPGVQNLDSRISNNNAYLHSILEVVCVAKSWLLESDSVSLPLGYIAVNRADLVCSESETTYKCFHL